MSKQNFIQSFQNSSKKTKVKWGIFSVLYILFIVWLRSPLWLIGLIIIFDLYITKKVKWAFWKKRYKEGEKKNVWFEWLDAGIFALVVATLVRTLFIEAYVIPSSSMEKSLLVGDYLFVSKVAYGPKIPLTPLSLPLVHNNIGLFGKQSESYSKAIQWDYKRLAGFGQVKRNDVVVFNFPNGDTIVKGMPQIIDYYASQRDSGKVQFKQWLETNRLELVARPVDKKDNYVKRCVAIPGDNLEIKDGVLYINEKPAENFPGQEYTYNVVLKDQLSEKAKAQLGLSVEDLKLSGASYNGYTSLVLTQKAHNELSSLPSVVSITRNIENKYNCFPFSHNYQWTIDNYGPLWIPQKGATTDINIDNLPLYERIINVYENNSLEVKGEKIYINGKETTQYTFNMDYFFMMGDNRHGSYDSRSWGFVPEDHIVGKASFIWFSSDKDKKFPLNIRWKRIFNGIK